MKEGNSQAKMIEQSPFQVDLRPDLWDRRYSPQDREILSRISLQYGLDPLTKEICMLQGNVYITATGLQKLAVRDPDYEGCEIEIIQADWENNFYVIKASVWKKGCTHPFEDFGDADPSTSKLRGRALFRHAITRARARAMRSAFAIPFCSVEELGDDNKISENDVPKRERATSKRPKSFSSPQEGVSFEKETKMNGNQEAISSVPPQEMKSVAKKTLEKPVAPKAELKATVMEVLPEDELGNQLLLEMQKADSMDTLKKAWQEFQEQRHILPNKWIEQIRETKDEKKMALSA